MKITRLKEHVLTELTRLWKDNAQYMPDPDRDVKNLIYLLTSDAGDSQWYVIGEGDTVFYIRNVIPNLSAVMFTLNILETTPEEAKSEIRDIMREYDLRRLTYTVPAPVVDITRVAQRIGFWPEGRMKDAIFYDGKYADLDLFGFYRSEVEDGKISLTGPAAVQPGKPKKRRRRSRRKKKKTPPTSE